MKFEVVKGGSIIGVYQIETDTEFCMRRPCTFRVHGGFGTFGVVVARDFDRLPVVDRALNRTYLRSYLQA